MQGILPTQYTLEHGLDSPGACIQAGQLSFRAGWGGCHWKCETRNASPSGGRMEDDGGLSFGRSKGSDDATVCVFMFQIEFMCHGVLAAYHVDCFLP